VVQPNIKNIQFAGLPFQNNKITGIAPDSFGVSINELRGLSINYIELMQ